MSFIATGTGSIVAALFAIGVRVKRPHAVALLLAIIPTVAGAQLVRNGVQIRDIARPLSPAAAAAMQRLLKHLADLPDGAYIARVNGAGAPVTVRNGMTLVITGKGFDQRHTNSLVGLFASDAATTGALLKVVDWSDTRITATVPADQDSVPGNTDAARLTVQVIRHNGIMQSLVVRGVRFRKP